MKKCIFLMLIVIGLVSCEKDEAVSAADAPSKTFASAARRTLSDSIQISKELSVAIGRTLTVKQSRDNAVAAIERLDSLSDAATLAALMESDKQITAFEQKRLDGLNTTLHGLYGGGTNNFKGQLLFELKRNSALYPLLLTGINLHATDIDAQLTNVVASQGLELSIPYAEVFNYSTLSRFTVAFDNLSDSDGQSGQVFTTVNQPGYCTCDPAPSTLLPALDDNYLNLNPSFTIEPADPEYNGGVGQGPGIITGGGVYSTVVLPTPISSSNRVWLTQNYNVANFGAPETQIMETFIPKLRVKGTSWKRTLDSHLRLEIVRAGSAFAINSNGTYSSSQSTYYFRVDISRHNLKHERWVDVNWQWDPNWTPMEGSQQILCFVLRHHHNSTSYSATTKLNINAQGQYTPDTSITATVSGSVNESILHGNRELDRIQVFATNVGGSEYDNATYSMDGLNYSVRRIDRFEYFFKHRYTNLSN